MRVTIEQLLSFLQATYPNCQRFTPHTKLRDQSIDGDDAVELLELLDRHFGVSFADFAFHQYFLEEIEILRSLSWFGLKGTRAIESEITVLRLFEYMQANAKSSLP